MPSRTSHIRRPTPDELANPLIGSPYRDRGRGPLYYDCFGLFLELARQWGVELRDPFHGGALDKDAYRSFYMHFRRLPNDEPSRPMDLLFFRRGDRQHVMTVLSERFVLDSTKNTGAARVELSEATRHPHEVYRLKCRLGS